MKTSAWSVCVLLATLFLAMAGCVPVPVAAPLTEEAHALTGAPQSAPFDFTPRQGTREEILQAHAGERGRLIEMQYFTSAGGNLALRADLGGKALVAEQVFFNSAMESYVRVELDGGEIYRIDTGPASPLTNLVALWAYDDHWALETALIDIDGENAVGSFAIGQVTIDGVLQNDARGYDEAFGLQILAGRPFFFFQKDGRIGYSYDGRETMLAYERIPHYQCCSDSALNPVQARDMVAFFARAGQDWYYVEIGQFGE